MKRQFPLMAVLALASMSVPAIAGSFSGTYTSTGVTPLSATLRITAADTVNTFGGFDIIGVSGLVDGVTITGVVNNPNQPNQTSGTVFFYDNVLFVGRDPLVSDAGLLFTTGDGLQYNLFAENASYALVAANLDGDIISNSSGSFEISSLTSSAVPESATWCMMILGLGAVGYLMRRYGQVRNNVRFV